MCSSTSTCPPHCCRMEEERAKDLRERDALAERIKKKDKEHTRKIVEKSDKKVVT